MKVSPRHIYAVPPAVHSKPPPRLIREMTAEIWPLVLAAVAIAVAAAAAEKKLIVAVEGLVSCQACGSAGAWDPAAARPMPAARVAMTCSDHRGRVVLYRAATADDNGYVFAELYTTTMRGGYFDPAEACTARLLASPDHRCSAATDINGGARGAPLRFQNTTIPGEYVDIDVYVTGPLAFRPPHCPTKIAD
ncbi:hypothetical protein ZIOFF_033107 [Zingiber officinale]|uniref:Uncharacterized protein n=2 Tax=Zingiber officinale TaxID=94328 RepID=A0A8J5L6U8_ZINOF|nr:hypothetical protein ZIOFF_033107 [Zingiber officinale]